MGKLLLKWFMPSAETLAETMAEAIAKGINNATTDKTEVVAKYAAVAAQIAEASTTISKMMGDGKVDKAEEKVIATMLLPAAQKVREMIV